MPEHMSRRDWLKLTALLSAGGRRRCCPLSMRAPRPSPTRRCASAICRSPTPRRCWWRTTTACSTSRRQAEKPTLLRSWAQVIEAFISGQVNVVHLLSPMTVWARFGSQVPAKVVAWNHVGGSA